MNPDKQETQSIPSTKKLTKKKSLGKSIVLTILITIGIFIGIVLCTSLVTFFYFTSPVPVEIIADYHDENISGVIMLPEVTELRDDTAISVINTLMYSSGSATNSTPPRINAEACSALFVENATAHTTLMGRNMDYDVSDYPAWIVFINASDRYKSWNLGYLGNDLTLDSVPLIPEMKNIAESKTVPAYVTRMLPWIVTDCINEKGLIIETNMRSKCSDLISYGTNTSSDITLCIPILSRYLIDRCADIDEVLEMVSSLNLYSAHNDIMDAHFAFAIMDASSRHGVLEIASDKIIWHEGAPGQTNYWLDEDALKISDICFGMGRWSVLENASKNISTPADMYDAMKKVYLGQYYFKTFPEEITYDIDFECKRSFYQSVELAFRYIQENGLTFDRDEYEKVQQIITFDPYFAAHKWNTLTYVSTPQNRDNITTCYNFITKVFRQMPYEEIKDAGVLSMTAFTYVTSSDAPVIHVKFFEHDKVFDFGFDKSGAKITALQGE